MIPLLKNDTKWIKIDCDYGNIYYRQIGKQIFLQGSVTGLTVSITVSIPFTLSESAVWIAPGNNLYYTKCYINANSAKLGILVGTGTENTTYSISHSFLSD